MITEPSHVQARISDRPSRVTSSPHTRTSLPGTSRDRLMPVDEWETDDGDGDGDADADAAAAADADTDVADELWWS